MQSHVGLGGGGPRVGSITQTASAEQLSMSVGGPHGMQGWPQVAGETFHTPITVQKTVTPQQRSGMGQTRPTAPQGSPWCGGIVGQRVPEEDVLVELEEEVLLEQDELVVLEELEATPVVMVPPVLPVLVPPLSMTTVLPQPAAAMARKEARVKRMILGSGGQPPIVAGRRRARGGEASTTFRSETR